MYGFCTCKFHASLFSHFQPVRILFHNIFLEEIIKPVCHIFFLITANCQWTNSFCLQRITNLNKFFIRIRYFQIIFFKYIFVINYTICGRVYRQTITLFINHYHIGHHIAYLRINCPQLSRISKRINIFQLKNIRKFVQCLLYLKFVFTVCFS